MRSILKVLAGVLMIVGCAFLLAYYVHKPFDGTALSEERPDAALFDVRRLDNAGSAVTVWPEVRLAPQWYLREVAPALAFTNADGRVVVLPPPYDYRRTPFDTLVR